MLAAIEHQQRDKLARGAFKGTIYQLLASLEHSSPFMRLLRQCPEVAGRLGDPASSCTVWLPRSIPRDIEMAGSGIIQEWVSRHITPFAVSTSLLYTMPNVPSLATCAQLQGPQLLRTRPIYHKDVGPSFSINFGACLVEQDLSASNGLVHIIDQALEEYQSLSTLIRALPAANFGFLLEAVAHYHHSLPLHRGGTFFAPTDAAFKALGLAPVAESLPRILAAHFCPEQIFYSNMLRGGDNATKPPPMWQPLPEDGKLITGMRAFHLQTSLDDIQVTVEVWRRGGLIEMRTDSGALVLSSDHIANDGVLHIVDRLICPLSYGDADM